MTTPETLLRRDAAGEYLKSRYGVGSAGTLAKLACVGGGPLFRKLGRFPVYSPSDLDDWAAGRTSAKVSSTSELQ